MEDNFTRDLRILPNAKNFINYNQEVITQHANKIKDRFLELSKLSKNGELYLRITNDVEDYSIKPVIKEIKRWAKLYGYSTFYSIEAKWIILQPSSFWDFVSPILYNGNAPHSRQELSPLAHTLIFIFSTFVAYLIIFHGIIG